MLTALGRAREDAVSGDTVPAHLRDTHYSGARKLGHGAGYVYPHDDPEGAEEQRYRPERSEGKRYYASEEDSKS